MVNRVEQALKRTAIELSLIFISEERQRKTVSDIKKGCHQKLE